MWLRDDGGALVLTLHIQPAAKKTEIVGVHGDALKIRLAAPPVDGKANAALIKFIAAQLGVSKNSVTLISGDTARAKRLRVVGVDMSAVRQQLSLGS
ncbi:MAG: YggU family protein [Rhodocyclaceae bacterium]|nr:YggU family protein [Rhodocyclaceae bacterium]